MKGKLAIIDERRKRGLAREARAAALGLARVLRETVSRFDGDGLTTMQDRALSRCTDALLDACNALEFIVQEDGRLAKS